MLRNKGVRLLVALVLGGCGNSAGDSANEEVADASVDPAPEDGLPPPTGPANEPLEILLPRAAGTSPEVDGPPISPDHRVFWAYPGIRYDIRVAAVGGQFPYAFSLENAPNGMTIDATTGEIDWPDPEADAVDVGLRLTDAGGTQVETRWTIHVDPDKFVFLDASAPGGGDGSFAAPYDQLSDLPDGDHAGQILYFRAGTYDLSGLPIDGPGDSWARVDFNAASKPVSWLAYPGERPVIDFGYAGAEGYVPFIRFSDGPAYFEGFETTRSQIIALQLAGSDYIVIRNNDMHDHGPGENGTNSAFVMTVRGFTAQTHYRVVQDNSFHGVSNSSMLKFYSEHKLLVEDNVFFDEIDPVAGEGECLALKDSVARFTVRGNVFHDLGGLIKSIGGNMAGDEVATSGEILFNNVRGGSLDALDLNQSAIAGHLFVYRNTFSGRVRIRNAGAESGPFELYNNVIVNDQSGVPEGSHIHHEEVSDPSRIVLSDNLVGVPSDGIIDETGALTPAFSSYEHTRGHSR